MSSDNPTIVALIPARSGSKRVPHKNIRPLAGHPLIAYSISAAVNSGVFSEVLVSTNSEKYADIARHYGAGVPFLRPQEYAESFSPDIEFVEHALNNLKIRVESTMPSASSDPQVRFERPKLSNAPGTNFWRRKASILCEPLSYVTNTRARCG